MNLRNPLIAALTGVILGATGVIAAAPVMATERGGIDPASVDIARSPAGSTEPR